MSPFMYWGGHRWLPCWVSEFVSEDRLAVLPRFGDGKVTGEPIAYDVMARAATWALAGAHNLARAYRPEGVP